MATTLRVALVSLAALVLSLALPTAAVQAAPNEQICAAGAVTQRDMAGVYLTEDRLLRVELYPCGGSYVEWWNEYGVHGASYYTVTRVPAQGVIARVSPPSAMMRLDASDAIGYKAAERGWIEVYTESVYDGISRVYRLRKIA